MRVMGKFQRDVAAGVISAVVGGIILDLITQHGGWSWHAFLTQGTVSGSAVGGWKIIGTAKVIMVLAVVAAAAVMAAMVIGSLSLLLM
jgi:uncharacterized membrane protein